MVTAPGDFAATLFAPHGFPPIRNSWTSTRSPSSPRLQILSQHIARGVRDVPLEKRLIKSQPVFKKKLRPELEPVFNACAYHSFAAFLDARAAEA